MQRLSGSHAHRGRETVEIRCAADRVRFSPLSLGVQDSSFGVQQGCARDVEMLHNGIINVRVV